MIGNKAILTTAALLLFLGAASIENGWGHARWSQRNEPGDWTVALYHFDDEKIASGAALLDDGPNGLNLSIGEPQEYELYGETEPAEEMGAAKGNYRFLAQALECTSPQILSATQTVEHPFTLSLEIWLKPLTLGADFRFGFLDGINVRIRHSEEDGDRFHILGLNSANGDDRTYNAPGFTEYPRVEAWNHYGITIRCPHVQRTEKGTYVYGEGSVARFFYFSHAVGFTGERILDVSGLEFPERGTPGVEIISGAFQIDGIHACSANPITGTLVVEYDGKILVPDFLFSILAHLLQVEEEIEAAPVSLIGKEIQSMGGSMNRALFDRSRGLIDLKTAVPLTLGIIGVRKMIQEGWTTLPYGFTLVWWAYQSLSKK